MVEKLKLELPEDEIKKLLDQCDSTLRSPSHEVRYIVREFLKGREERQDGEEVRSNDD